MNKPISINIKETKEKLANICNESNLSPVVLDLVLYSIYSEVHYIAEKQTREEEKLYIKSLEEKKEKDNDSIEFN